MRHMALVFLQHGISMDIRSHHILSRIRVARLSINMRHRPRLLLLIMGRKHLLIMGRSHLRHKGNWIGDTRGLLITTGPWIRLDYMQCVRDLLCFKTISLVFYVIAQRILGSNTIIYAVGMTILKHEKTTIRKVGVIFYVLRPSLVFCDIIAPRVSESNTIIYIFDMTILEHKEYNDKKKDERRIRNFQEKK